MTQHAPDHIEHALKLIGKQNEIIALLRQDKAELVAALEQARQFLGSSDVHLNWPKDSELGRDVLNTVTAAIANAWKES